MPRGHLKIKLRNKINEKVFNFGKGLVNYIFSYHYWANGRMYDRDDDGE